MVVGRDDGFGCCGSRCRGLRVHLDHFLPRLCLDLCPLRLASRLEAVREYWPPARVFVLQTLRLVHRHDWLKEHCGQETTLRRRALPGYVPRIEANRCLQRPVCHPQPVDPAGCYLAGHRKTTDWQIGRTESTYLDVNGPPPASTGPRRGCDPPNWTRRNAGLALLRATTAQNGNQRKTAKERQAYRCAHHLHLRFV